MHGKICITSVLPVQINVPSLTTYNEFIFHAHFLLFLNKNTTRWSCMHISCQLRIIFPVTQNIVLFIKITSLSFLQVFSIFVGFKIMQSSINSLLYDSVLFLQLPNLFLKLKCTHRTYTFLHKLTLLFYIYYIFVMHGYNCVICSNQPLYFFYLNALIVHTSFL